MVAGKFCQNRGCSGIIALVMKHDVKWPKKKGQQKLEMPAAGRMIKKAEVGRYANGMVGRVWTGGIASRK